MKVPQVFSKRFPEWCAWTAVYARIDTELKNNAENILAKLGITPSSAIQMLYSQIVLQKGMPFDLKKL